MPAHGNLAPLRMRAQFSSSERHNARMVARALMDPKDVLILQVRDVLKYRNPSGPSFDDALERNLKQFPNIRSPALQELFANFKAQVDEVDKDTDIELLLGLAEELK